MKKPALVILLIFLTGCAYVEPLVQEFNIISVPEERKIGYKIAEQVALEMPLSRNPDDYARIQPIAQRLVQALPRRDFSYQFFVVKDQTPNAFTIPGGFIYIHTGLLKFANDDELAGVLAHEMGHAYLRHPAKGLSRQMGTQYLTGLLFGEKHGQFKSIALQIAQGGILSRYGRQDEREADDTAYYLMQQAGMKTNGLLSFLKKLLSLQGTSTSPLDFLSSHPPTPERIAWLEALERSRQVTYAPRPQYAYAA